MKQIMLMTGVFLLLFSACKTEQETQVIKAISDGQVILENGETVPIPGAKDSDTVVFFLIRHAEKGEGEDPNLTDIGFKRAHKLADMMKGQPVDFLFSTSFKRTTATAQYLAMQKVIPFVFYKEEGQYETAELMLSTAKGKKIVMVGHSNTIPALLNYLSKSDKYKDIPHDEYDNFYIASVKEHGKAEILHFKY